ILYQALLAKNARLLEGLRPTFTEGFKANDSGKLYAAIKDVMASQEGEMYLRSTVRDAAGQLQGAMINAMTVLEARAQERLLPVATTVHQAALLLYERTQLLRVQIELTLGEYQELLTKQIRQQYDKAAKETGKKARALIFSGMLTLPGPAQNHIFKATFWVADTAEGLKEKLIAVSDAGADAMDTGWRSVVVGLGGLEPKAHAVVGQLRTTAADAKLRAHTAFVGMRGMANMDVALSMGALFFQQDGLKASLDDLDRVAGGRYREAVSGVAASAAGVMGVGIEATGVAIRRVAQAMEKASIAQAHAVNALAVGKGLIRFGGVTSALSGAADAVQFGFAAYRNQRAGDFPARSLYSWAAGFALTGGAMGAVAAYYGLSSLMGPLGLAIALGLAAYASSQSAKDHQSTALEKWCRRCYFGVHNESPAVWWNGAKTVITVPPSPSLEAELVKNEAANNDQYTAIGALNAAILGLDVAAEFVNNPQPTLDISSVEPIWSQALVYRIRLPAWDPGLSAYTMHVSLKSYEGNHIAVVEQCNASASVQLSRPQKRPSYHVDANAARMPTSMNPLIAGTLILAFLERDIESATVKAKYWPDKTQPELFAELVLTTLR
ncbi:hypothetical protein C4E15_29950, partial [Achromobacter spanius]